jgi:hypothetical protein
VAFFSFDMSPAVCAPALLDPSMLFTRALVRRVIW